MFRAVNGLGSQRPGAGAKQDHEEQEEGSHDFEENNVSHSAKRAEKSAHASGDAPGGTPRGTNGICYPRCIDGDRSRRCG